MKAFSISHTGYDKIPAQNNKNRSQRRWLDGGSSNINVARQYRISIGFFGYAYLYRPKLNPENEYPD